MKLTKSQKEAVNFNGNVSLVACPGSGKTRTIIAKLIQCIEKIEGTPRKIACITYTNTAAQEIETRLRRLSVQNIEQYCDISTIHSFCLNNVLRYFHWKIPVYRENYLVISPDSEIYRNYVSLIFDEYNITSQVRDQFELINRNINGSPIISDDRLSTEAVEDFWERLEKDGLIDFPSIIYWSYKLIVECDSIARALAHKFAWFLVDEFQDTSQLQVEILKLISSENASSFFIVGDPYQSIYRFAGAMPELFDSFAKEIHANKDFQLLENWRSSYHIIDQAEKLLPRTPPMVPVGNTANFKYEPEYIHASTAFNAITDYFLPALEEHSISYGKSAILAPWWIKLLHIGRRLREYGVPIIGPGSRPYRRQHLFAPLAEELCGFLIGKSSDKIYSIERELFFLLNRTKGDINYHIFSYDGRKSILRILIKAKFLKDKYAESGKDWLIAMAQSVASVLIDDGILLETNEYSIVDSANDMLSDMVRNQIDVDNISVEDIGLYSDYENSIKLLTMHRAKGTEFDAVAIVDLHDGRLPNYRARTQDDFAESKRLLYVAITRARKIVMYITDEEDHRNRPSPYLLQDGLDMFSQRIIVSE